MQRLAELWRRALFLLRRERFDREMSEEMRFHLEMKVEEYVEGGMTPEEARYAARRRFGNQTLLQEANREVWSFVMIETLLRDVRYAARALVKSPGFALVAVVTLALGIGANTAVFSLANALLLRPPEGVSRPEEIVMLGRTLAGSDFGTFSYPDYADCRDQSASFTDLAAYRDTGLHLNTGESAELLSGMLVSGNYFKALGVGARLGRTLSHEDDGTPGSNPVVVISDAAWRSRFGSDPNIVGRVVTLNNYPFTVVGVAQEGFAGTGVGTATDAWLPLSMYAQADPVFYEKRLEERRISWLNVIGRLKPGVSPQQAQAEMTTIARRLEQAYPDMDRGLGIAIAEGLGLQPRSRGEARTTMGMLLAVAGLVLLIVCANVANLLLARGEARRKEIAVRMALGAGRTRLVRQLLTEALLISLTGGAVGVLLAFWSRGLLLNSNFLTGVSLAAEDLQLDGRVLGFTLLASLATGLIAGLVPALKASDFELHAMLKDRGASGPPRSRFRSALVVCQVALSVVVLVCAGLLVRTLMNAQSVKAGFDADRILLVPIDLAARGYTEERMRLFYQQLAERVRAIPGVGAASMAVTVPLGGSWRTGFRAEGQPTTELSAQTDYDIVAPRYFETAGIPVVRGRDFDEQDGPNSPRVVIVGEEFARRFFPGEDPLGKRLSVPRFKGDDTYCEVVGVVKDIKYERLTEQPRPYLYEPLSQQRQPSATLFVRSRGGDPSALAGAVGREVQALDRAVPIYGIRTMAERLRDSLTPQRSAATLLAIFGLLALLIASVGLYGVLAYSVGQRQREIGIRMALGATGGDVLNFVFRQGAILIAGGLASGLAVAFAAGRALTSLLYGVSAADPLTYAAVALALIAAALAACYLPARRAAKVDPGVALRYE
jgi:macrolide transport system ATP-binding/permease protein